jgi:hypothetical protein
MFKRIYLFILLGLMACLQSVWADPLYMNHERFVHLSEDQQKEFVIYTMEFMVELESKYQHEVTQTGFNWDRYRKFTALMNKLQSFVMSSAHAAGGKQDDWDARGEEFAKIIGKDGDKCIYAGWVSVIKDNYCVHPTLSGDADIVKAYKSKTSCGGGAAKIACNPVIFGYKNASDKSLFCVDAGVNKSHNSSLNCMKDALGNHPGADAPKKRLDNIVAHMAKNKDVTDKVDNYIFKMCLCPGPSTHLDETYHAKIRPDRTCYALMNTLKKTETSCSVHTDSDIVKILNLESLQEGISKNLDDKQYDVVYNKFLDGVKKNPEYDKICKPATTPEKPEVKPAEDPALTCASKNCGYDDKNQKTCDFEVTDTKAKKVIATQKGVAVEDDATDYGLTFKDATGKDTKVGCKVDPDPEDAISCSATATSDDKKVLNATVAFTPDTIKIDTKSVKWSPDPTTSDDKSASFDIEKLDTLTVSYSATTDDGKTLSCSAEEYKKDAKAPTITVAGETPTTTSRKVNATVVGEQGDYKIVWYRKGAEGLKFAPAAVKKDDTTKIKLAGDGAADDKKTEATDDKKDTKTAATGDFSEGATTVTEARLTADYQTCAKLVKGADVIQGGCITIPKFVIVGGGGGPQQPYFRGSSNTSAQGIR